MILPVLENIKIYTKEEIKELSKSKKLYVVKRDDDSYFAGTIIGYKSFETEE